MTKPTYSELEAENLRVRGLLQRIVRALKYYDSHQTSEAMALLRDTIMVCELDAATEGAESADIGKLDGADKSGKLDALVAEHADDCKKCEGTGFEHILRTTAACRSCHGTGKEAGSAETGGEKAGTLGELIERQYPSDPVTGKTIVVRGSREPEKLNNAQNRHRPCLQCGKDGFDQIHNPVNRHLADKSCYHPYKPEDAMAESSLSSPPPREKP